jgi:hypothetical protein
VETRTITKKAGGFQIKAVTGFSFFGLAETNMFAEVKTMISEGTGETTGEAVAYSASASGTVTVKPAAGGGVGNCSVVEVGEIGGKA